MSLLAGCASLDPARAVGKFLGGKAGTAVADALPTPKADVKADSQGGNFCPVMAKFGWPLADSLSASPNDSRTILKTEMHGERQCGWRKP